MSTEPSKVKCKSNQKAGHQIIHEIVKKHDHYNYDITDGEHKQVQSDELRLKIFSAVLWIAMSIAPVSRLWLGAEVSHTRGRDFITSMMKRTARCCKGTVLLVTDGLVTYIKAVKKAFSIS